MPQLSKDNLFDPKLVSDLVNKIQGKSSLAKLSSQVAIPFNGSKVFTFTMDNEIDIVAENGAKTHGGVTVDPVVIQPIKIEYGARVSDEFVYAAEEEKINILKAFNEGFARKVAKGLDLMAMHGVNPRTGTASEVIGTNHFDAKVEQTVDYDSAQPSANIEAATGLVLGSEGEVTGLALAPAMSTALAQLHVNGVQQFPQLAWGASPESLNGLDVDVNATVSKNSDDRAIVGDFRGAFQWGYAKEIPLEVIKYGDPDNTGKDLRGHNQVYIRSELYLGWGILRPESFARITETTGA